MHLDGFLRFGSVQECQEKKDPTFLLKAYCSSYMASPSQHAAKHQYQQRCCLGIIPDRHYRITSQDYTRCCNLLA